MQIENLNDICQTMSIKMTWKSDKQMQTHINLLYEPPKMLKDIFSKKKPDKLAVIKNGYIYFEVDKTLPKDITFKGLTKKSFRDKIITSKIIILENKIKNINDEIETCKAIISKTKNYLNDAEKHLSELKSTKLLLITELKNLKDNSV